jgi:hypothetical protein
MKTVFQTRRERLKELIRRYGTIAALNLALGWEATNARISQIQNGSIRSDRGKPYELGDPTAREIEEKLGLEVGWLDTPVELEGLADDTSRQMLSLFNQLPAAERSTALRLLNALAEPPKAEGTTGQ